MKDTILKYLFYFIIIMSIITFFQYLFEKSPEEKLQKEIKKEQEFFKGEKTEFLKKVEELYNKKKHKEALLLINQYIHIKDKDYIELKEKIKKSISDKNKKEIQASLEKERKEKAPLYLAKLKKLPASKYEENLELYEKLLRLYPDNKKYDEKVKHYGAKVLEKQLYYGKEPTQSKWDGSYYVVEKYLKKVMNDPSSLEFKGCTQVYKQDDGWLVGCQYRGKNGFGAKVLEAKWFTIRQLQVVKVEAGNTYKW